MLWKAGQQRKVREERARLAGLFWSARDAALDVLVTTGRAKPTGTWRLPRYARDDSPPVRSPAIRDATLAKLGAMIPGIVRRGDS